MEIMEEIEKEQISFDFLNEIASPLEKAENFDWVADETLVVILKTNNQISPNFDICGKKMIDWVALATSGCKQKIVDEPAEENLLSTIRDLAEGFQFVAVFYCDTPLLKKSTFLEIMDFFSKKKMNVLKLSRGFVFKADYLKTARLILSTTTEVFDEQDFTVVDTAQKVSYAFNVLNERILNYHKENGVVLFGENTIFVDADVEIEAGAVIYPNNILKGETYIGKTPSLKAGIIFLTQSSVTKPLSAKVILKRAKWKKAKLLDLLQGL